MHRSIALLIATVLAVTAVHGAELTILCAAGLRKPAEAAAATYTAATGTQVRFQFAGSGQLMGVLAAGAPADLVLVGDGSYLTIGRERKVLREGIPLASQHPVIAVRAGNPAKVAGLETLLAGTVKFSLANPEAASIGRTLKVGLGERWPALAKAATVTKPTVTELVNDLQVGSVDAAVVWNSTIAGLPGLMAVEDPALAKLEETPIAAVSASTKQPSVALAFARWLASPEHGGPAWTAAGFTAKAGDIWAVKPVLSLYAGSVNRLGIQATLKEFEEREGVEITTKFNGCGILCAEMKLLDDAAMPDAYYACDICFVAPVAKQFPTAVILTEADIVIAVPKGNPKGIKDLADLAKPGIRLGIGNHRQSTLGYMTDRMLDAAGIKAAVLANAVSQVPVGDLLVTQLRAGTLDAAIVYNTNAKPQAETLDTIPLLVPGARAMQPFAVRALSPRAQLAGRLLEALVANRARFESAGFRWRADGTPVPSSKFSADPADANRPK
ncbi:hypothetical protein LBMAG53_28770 [Planctomycetota bacterium]|nr:hypothetical protein LBMAG53_28770 [Planctomycetota bacterium]